MHTKTFTVPELLLTRFTHIAPKKQCHAIGRPRLDIRTVFTGVLYRLRTGCQWKHVPRQFGSPSTCHRYYQQWQKQGLWKKLWSGCLGVYMAKRLRKTRWCSMDAALHKSPLGGRKTGPNPTDRGKLGCKVSMLTDERGVVLGIACDQANRHDTKLFEPTLKSMTTHQGLNIKIKHLCLDKAYYSKQIIASGEDHGILMHVRKRGEPPLLGVVKGKARRWVCERSFSWLNRFRAVLIRWDKKPQNYMSGLYIAVSWYTLQAAIGL